MIRFTDKYVEPTNPRDIKVISTNGSIRKENKSLFLIISPERQFHIKNITKVDNSPIRNSRYVLKINNNVFYKINEKRNLNDESYISILRFGKLKKNECETSVMNIW